MFKVLLYSFSMCRHIIRYQILSISKNIPCFLLLITGHFNVLYYTGHNRSGFQVFNHQKCITLSLLEAYAKSMLAIIPGA